MNERMREPFYTLIWKASIGYNDSWSQVDPEVLQRFAELIVRECADLFEVEWGNEKLTGNDVGYVLKKHFGVES